MNQLTMEKDRKLDHIKLAFESQTLQNEADQRFNYEPVISGHPSHKPIEFSFLGKTLGAPMWVSSMTGGTKMAHTINHNLARACKEFRIGMGLGSCRKLLDDDTYFEDFNLRPIMGDDLPLFANLGIAQVEILLAENKLDQIKRLVEKLQADGLIIHINPLQEWMQPEGNRIAHPPIETIERLLGKVNFPVIVKEVGQGMGPESLLRLLQLPLAAVDFGAFGGTNFSLVELLRQDEGNREKYEPFIRAGHTAGQMLDIVNHLADTRNDLKCNQLIISGGIRSYLDGYYHVSRSKIPAIYAQASAFLKHSQGEYEPLHKFVSGQIEGYRMAQALLRIRE
jgi:isopentenyl-diphosphate Delta-isomerase